MLIGRNPQTLDEGTVLSQVMLLADLARVDAYRRAVAKLVKPGDLVAEVQCGAGLLGRLALETGASKLISIDRRPGATQLAQIATSAIRPRADVRYEVAEPGEAILSEKVDVAFTELIGFLGTTERMAEDLGAFARNNLREGGSVCPRRVEVYGALARWERGPSLMAGVEQEQQPSAWTELGPLYFIESDWQMIDRLGPTRLLYVMDPISGDGQPSRWEISCEDAEPGADAVAIWFRAELAPDVHLDTGPDAEPTMFAAAIVPIPAALHPGADGAPAALRMEFEPQPLPGRISITPGAGAPTINI